MRESRDNLIIENALITWALNKLKSEELMTIFGGRQNVNDASFSIWPIVFELDKTNVVSNRHSPVVYLRWTSFEDLSLRAITQQFPCLFC